MNVVFLTMPNMLILLAAVVLNAASAVAATGTTASSYTNPCEEFGTASKLNDLYNTVPADGEDKVLCPSGEGPSYKCSGVLVRSGLGDAGRTYKMKGGIADAPNLFNISDPVYTVGITNMSSTVCPPDIVDGQEYPGFCSDPTQIYLGMMSFSYLRRDIAPSIDIWNEWIETGIDPITGASKDDKSNTGPIVAWPFGGYILLPEDVDETNPDVIVPETNPDGSFWDFDRFGNVWPMDGSTYGRSLCGNGPLYNEMYMGIGGKPMIPFEDILFYQSNGCPPDAEGWINTGIPDGYSLSCPATIDTPDKYYEEWFQKIDEVVNIIDCSSEEYKTMSKEVCEGILALFQFFPQQLGCGIAPEYFDELFIPLLSRSMQPLETLYDNLDKLNIPNTTMFGFSLWNEVAIKSWNGIGLSDLGQYLVIWYDDTEESKELAFQRAEEFYEASGINGAPNIRIPVVYRNNTKLFNDPDVDYQVVFTCPADDHGNHSESAVGNMSSSSSSVTYSLPSFLSFVTMNAAAIGYLVYFFYL